MLIKVTNFCSMGCTHCMEDSTIKGLHMTREIFSKALLLTQRLEGPAWTLGCPPAILLSGGECTEHPDFVTFLTIVVELGLWPVIITNGMWLANKELREAILRPEWPQLMVQVTNDSRFYPTAPPTHDDSRITYVPALTQLLTLGRAGRRQNLSQLGVPPKQSPSSFNFRSAVRHFRSIEQALILLRTRATTGQSGWCSPSISSDGSMVAGESNACFKIGTVDSTSTELTQATIDMKCNACGLVDNLSQEQKRAIGESSLFLGTE